MLFQSMKEDSVQKVSMLICSQTALHSLHSCAFLIGTVMMQYQKHYPALLVMDVSGHK